ncbi:MAG: hypothetical protein E4H01_04230 [Lysobacterales bacterium]|nr:MAG: hypothetical protein E4H01_04230 [Xanthomonadales bacterium]
MKPSKSPTTRLCTYNTDAITVRGADLVDELIGGLTFTEMTYFTITDEFRSARKAVPGFGHHMHKPDDPRTPKLFALAEAEGVSGEHISALRALSAAVDERFGKHLTINATGAVGALLGEIGIPAPIMRGIAVISRPEGLVAHIAEEQQSPSMHYIWELVEEGVPYEAGPDNGD